MIDTIYIKRKTREILLYIILPTTQKNAKINLKYEMNNKNLTKKIKIYILYTFIFLAAFSLFIAVLDCCCYFSYPNVELSKKSIKDYVHKYKDKENIEIIEKYLYDTNNTRNFRKIENPNSNSDSIVLFGFSNIYGLNLNEDETISHYLGKLTTRTVYNRTKPDASLNHMYYQLSNEDFYKRVKKSKYVIYFYTPKQMIIMNHKMNFCQCHIYYKLENGKLTRYKKIPLYKKSYILAAINRYLFYNNIAKNYCYKKDAELFKTILIESKKEVQKHWGDDVKFIIVRCEDSKNTNEDKIFDSLKKQGFIVLDVYKYTNIQIQNFDTKKLHKKNTLFWENVSQVLIDKIPDLK